MIITMQHLRTVPYFHRRAGFCLPKSREWFKRHGLDFADFIRSGIDEGVLLATDDSMAQALVKWAHECEAKHGQQ